METIHETGNTDDLLIKIQGISLDEVVKFKRELEGSTPKNEEHKRVLSDCIRELNGIIFSRG